MAIAYMHDATADGKIVNGMQVGDLRKLHKHPAIVCNKRVFNSRGKASPASLCLTPYRVLPQNLT
jgi:hypothetical protein